MAATAAVADHWDSVQTMSGNPHCSDLGLKGPDDKNQPGTASDGTVQVSWSLSGDSVSWTLVDDGGVTQGIDKVIVKGGPNANVYSYNEATSDGGLTPPTNPNNDKPFGFSHVGFCYDTEEPEPEQEPEPEPEQEPQPEPEPEPEVEPEQVEPEQVEPEPVEPEQVEPEQVEPEPDEVLPVPPVVDDDEADVDTQVRGEEVIEAEPAAEEPEEPGTLPFTGAEAIAVAILGGGLVVTGSGLLRAARRHRK